MYEIYDLKCNGIRNPQGIPDGEITFSWKLRSNEKNVVQTSYRIDLRRGKNLIWTSGEKNSTATKGIVYNGPNLNSGTNYTWQVISVDNYGNHAVSGEGRFLTGLFKPDVFQGAWIEAGVERIPVDDISDVSTVLSGKVKAYEKPEEHLNKPVYFRKLVFLKKEVQTAVVYSSARGIYRLSLDGEAISPILAPEFTSYGHFLEYQTIDVTNAMKKSTNHVFGCILADGWYTLKPGERRLKTIGLFFIPYA